MSNEKDLAEQRTLAKLAHLMPEIEGEIDGMTRTCLNQICQKVRSHTLTPDEAFAYCMELYSYQRLRQRFHGKVDVAE